ncbi:MAG: DUF4011 domain-containing protein [Alphaproteobacteria bacterium]|nr:DUF4011 domain-containing protein [Alphaproteobacteria bacterium]
MIRFCPKCLTERPAAELSCEGEWEGAVCNWDLTRIPLREPGSGAPTPTAEPISTRPMGSGTCANGHATAAGDLLCPQCGIDLTADPPPTGSATDLETYQIGDWRIEERLSARDRVYERFGAVREHDGRRGLLTLYAPGQEPDSEVYEALRGLSLEHVPAIIELGHWQDRAFEVSEDLRAGTLADIGLLSNDMPTISRVLTEIGGALDAFAEHGLRHRDLRPEAILVRARSPLDLVITDFGSARLSEFDLDVVSPLGTTRYSAPEVIAGGVAAASDWWSLGMVLLEQVTRGECFAGASDQAFLIQVMARGAPIPAGLDPAVDLLLRGLLARDRKERWGWAEVQRWLSGDYPPRPASSGSDGEPNGRQSIRLNSVAHVSPGSFALAAAQASTWDEAKALMLGGDVATWVLEAGFDASLQSSIRQITQMQAISDDARLSVALKVLNPSMPLVWRGAIVSPAWLLENPEEGYAIIDGPIPEMLAKMDAEPWLMRLKSRAVRARERAQQLGIAINELEFEVHTLATSRTRLAAMWTEKRRLLPDTDHSGLTALIERRQTSDEDFIVLLSADVAQFRTAETIVDEAALSAERAGIVVFDRQAALGRLNASRRDLFLEIDQRLEGFARCGVSLVDEWADQFRLERRLPMDRALVLLSVPAESWLEPPKQTYVSTLLDFFAKRITTTVMRGALTRMVIGKTTARLDLTELGTERQSAGTLIDHLLLRTGTEVEIDPELLASDPRIEGRLRRLHTHATLYKRDTGIDGLYLGFPFLFMQENKPSVRPRVAPVLLWPMRLIVEAGARGRVKVAFDREREEVRLNPAFEPLLGSDVAKRWRDATTELLGRASLSVADVGDALENLVSAVRSRELSSLPAKDAQVRPGNDQLVCAAALFHLAYRGQGVLEDLRQLRSMPPNGSSLETVLKVSEPTGVPPAQKPREVDRYFTAPSDPSQERAVIEARSGAGLVVEGPPGTGKSQTIVNVVGDAIGRQQKLLIVCQKQSALAVVYKRLVAEGLGDRILKIDDINKDRQQIIRMIRDQVSEVFSRPADTSNWRQKRQQLAGRIEKMEGDLDRHNKDLHAENSSCGLSYRAILGDLIRLESGDAPPISAPELQAVVAGLDVSDVANLQEVCGPLARHWLPAQFEESPLQAFRQFNVDPVTATAIRNVLNEFAACEEKREAVFVATPNALPLNDPEPFRRWLESSAEQFQQLDQADRDRLARWIDYLKPFGGGAEGIDADLSNIEAGLQALSAASVDTHCAAVVLGLTEPQLLKRFAAVQTLKAPPKFAEYFSMTRGSMRREHSKFMRENGIASSTSLEQALVVERALRPLRAQLEAVRTLLGEEAGELSKMPAQSLLRIAGELRRRLQKAADLAALAIHFPMLPALRTALHSASAALFEECLERVRQGIARFEVRQASISALERMSPWLGDAWLGGARKNIEADKATKKAFTRLMQALPTLPSYQRFRQRAAQLDSRALEAFSCLRTQADTWSNVPADLLDVEIRRTIERESRLAWKEQIEQERPALLMDESELRSRAEALAGSDAEIRDLNRRLLKDGFDASRLRPQREWENITKLSGQRTRRLREFLDRGVELGLMSMRPIWMMNPDVASRVLPLRRSMFDIVVYDEASQIPIEYTLPTLYRSSRMFVSGDEKQMPPTNFFSSKVENDESDAYEDEELDEGATEAELSQLTEAWNRREIKDCPDLLQLAKSVLPSTTLQIHYRSAYRELIQFSNAGFYADKLSVPVRHPDNEVRRVKPIEVIRADGLYTDQSNRSEAERVVEVIASYWKAPSGARKSVAVVTFNRTQADLIEDVISARAQADPSFLAALNEESERIQDGEDMRFFVKNVENVQGDERDIIVFSTTFGRNTQGTFRKSFGVLGQSGGERRLNVAVTRAKERVVLVTSMPTNEISGFIATHQPAATPRDFLQAYMQYAHLVSSGDLESARKLLARLSRNKPTELRGPEDAELDGFALAVRRYIQQLGYAPLSATSKGAFGLDFVIEDPRTGLFGIGIECDAPRDLLLSQARARELWRPSVLRKSVGQIHRVSSHSWLRSAEQEKAKLRAAIESAVGSGSAA